MKIPLKHTKSRAPLTTSSEVHASGSRPASLCSASNRVASPTLGGDGSPESGFDEDSQPRLVGLSQPFFATGIPSNSKPAESEDQTAALGGAAAAKELGSKLRVLVAEDNLVNQEVVLRYVCGLLTWLFVGELMTNT